MDTDKDSGGGYRVPILRLSDVVPAKKAPSEPPKKVSEKEVEENVEEESQSTEAQKMLEQFIIETEKELKNRNEAFQTANKNKPPKPPKEEVSLPQEEQVPEEEPTPKEEPLREERQVLEEPLPKEVPIHFTTPEVQEVVPEALVAPVPEKIDTETPFEKFVFAAAERLDPLKEKPVKIESKEDTGEEIANIFESYLQRKPDLEAEVEKEPEEDVVHELSMAPPLLDLPDIWEQDARTPKKSVFHKRTFKSVTKSVPETVLKEPIEEKSSIQEALGDPFKTTVSTALHTPLQKLEVQENEFESKTVEPEKEEQKNLEKMNDSLLSEKEPQTQYTAPPEEISTLTPQEQNPTPLAVVPEKIIELPSEEIRVVEKSDVLEKNPSNLSLLRDRVRKEHKNTEDASAVAETLSPVDIEQENKVLNETVSKKIEILNMNDSEDSAPETRARPTSKHAQVLAQIADRLRNISVESKNNVTFDTHFQEVLHEPKVPTENTSEKSEVADVDKKPDPLAPGEIREPEPVPPPHSSISPIRTFRQDVEQAVTKNKTSIVTMVASEEARRNAVTTIRTAPTSRFSSFSAVLVGATLVLFVGTLAIGGFVLYGLQFSGNSGNSSISALFNMSVPYVVSNQTREELLLGLVQVKDSTHNSLGSIIEISLLNRFTEETEDGAPDATSPEVFLQKIAPNIPASLLRSTTDTLVLGIHEMSKNQTFLLFTVDSRATGFGGMFEWEENMNSDLSPLFGPIVSNKPSINQNQGSTPTPVAESIKPEDKPVFEDLHIANKEVRGIRNQKGELVLLWSMPDESHVVIATNETTMRVILDKLVIYTQTQ